MTVIITTLYLGFLLYCIPAYHVLARSCDAAATVFIVFVVIVVVTDVSVKVLCKQYYATGNCFVCPELCCNGCSSPVVSFCGEMCFVCVVVCLSHSAILGLVLIILWDEALQGKKKQKPLPSFVFSSDIFVSVARLGFLLACRGPLSAEMPGVSLHSSPRHC